MTTDSNIRHSIQENSLTSNTFQFQGLRSPGLFARLPWIGLMMILLGSLAFGALGYAVKSSDPFLQWDMSATKTLYNAGKSLPSSLMEYVIFSFFLGKEIIIIIGAILAIYFLFKHFWQELAMVSIGWSGAGLIWYFLSQYFDRPRPPNQLAVLRLADQSFPSGLALAAVLCYGLLAYLLVPKMPSRFWKWIVIIALTLLILFIGLSSVFLGNHYVSDVVAGYSLGIAWAGFVYTVTERLFRRETIRDHESLLHGSSSEALRTPGWFGKRPAIGLMLFLFGGLSFAGLGYNLLVQGPLVQLDTSVYRDLLAQARAAPWAVNEIMLFGFFVGKQVILLIFTILILYFIYQRYWRELAMLVLSSGGGNFVWTYFINYFDRPRPSEQTGLVINTIPSFPSGHAMSAVICYGLLAYLLIPKMPSVAWKWVVGIAALLIVLFDGFSRIFQGSHYLTDVLAGYALGLAWASLVYTLIEGIFIRKKN
jgi:Membrane-associated phospholipid phosphatase